MGSSLADPVRQVGPYRLEELLGTGGMGEVYSGYDERLDRPVALKRLWPGDAADDRARKRLQREARALARLHHPSIVQVFDWVETGEGDWIVMELVSGPSLRQLLRGGALAADRVVSLARDVLAGLAVAHQAGLVHRDLKAENVMVVAASGPGQKEQAKILDFGLARPFERGQTETQITLGDRLAGTLTAMSPEQCRGREIGPPSDLFSLGSMLYEMAIGIRPFRGENPATTIQQICAWNPPALHTVDPLVPERFSFLVERLMEKDPRRRPASAQQALTTLDNLTATLAKDTETTDLALPVTTRDEETRLELKEQGTRKPGAAATQNALEPLQAAPPEYGPRLATHIAPQSDSASKQRPHPQRWARFGRWAAVCLGVAALLALAAYQLLHQDRTLYVAVPPLTTVNDGSPGQAPDLVAHAVVNALTQGLLNFRHLAALLPAVGPDTPTDPVSLARSLRADEVLTSSLECSGQACVLVLRRLGGTDGQPQWVTSFSVDTSHLLNLSQATIEHLRGAYPKAKLRPGIPDLSVQAEDYAAYLRLKKRFDNREQGFSTDQLLAELAQLESSSPRYLDLPVFAASALLRRFAETREPRDLERARAAVARARAIAADDPRTLIQEVGVLQAAGDYESAQVALDSLRRIEPGNPRRLHLHARLLERQGQVDEALAMMRRAVEQRPAAEVYFNLGNMLYRHGDVDGARAALQASLETSPRYFNGLSLLAQLELVSGDPERAAEHYEALLARSPATAELSNAGTAYLLIGRFDEAAHRFRQALELAPNSPAALLNLADSELLVGREQEAQKRYRELIELIERDPHPDKYLTVGAQAKAHLGDANGALAAVHEALRLAPESRLTAYEAALVYALLGDRASSLWQARRALELGLDARWFSFPWFDSLRAELQRETQADAQ